MGSERHSPNLLGLASLHLKFFARQLPSAGSILSGPEISAGFHRYVAFPAKTRKLAGKLFFPMAWKVAWRGGFLSFFAHFAFAVVTFYFFLLAVCFWTGSWDCRPFLVCVDFVFIYLHFLSFGFGFGWGFVKLAAPNPQSQVQIGLGLGHNIGSGTT